MPELWRPADRNPEAFGMDFILDTEKLAPAVQIRIAGQHGQMSRQNSGDASAYDPPPQRAESGVVSVISRERRIQAPVRTRVAPGPPARRHRIAADGRAALIESRP